MAERPSYIEHRKSAQLGWALHSRQGLGLYLPDPCEVSVLSLLREQDCAGRLHRKHATKSNVRIIDVVDTGHPALLRMWEKRRQGYRAMGYRMDEESGSAPALSAKIYRRT